MLIIDIIEPDKRTNIITIFHTASSSLSIILSIKSITMFQLPTTRPSYAETRTDPRFAWDVMWECVNKFIELFYIFPIYFPFSRRLNHHRNVYMIAKSAFKRHSSVIINLDSPNNNIPFVYVNMFHHRKKIAGIIKCLIPCKIT